MGIIKPKVNDNEGLTVEQKFAKALIQLRQLRPFYSAIYEVMNKRKTEQIDTMGVTTNELLYNETFVNNTPYEELLFVFLHEIAHIALKHCTRKGPRDPDLWNIACDLYVNKVLAEEFNLRPGLWANVNSLSNKISFSMPRNLCYCSSINTDLDFAEKIYEDMQNQIDEQRKNNVDKARYKIVYKGSDKNIHDSYSIFEVNVSDMPKILSMPDLIDNMKDVSAQEQEADKIVADAVTRSEMNNGGFGTSSDGLFDKVKGMLKSELDWRKLLSRYIIKAISKDSSFKVPDKRMMYQKAIYPGMEQESTNELRGVKVCIDTSGSISDDDIRVFYGQVWDLLKKYKVQAELIYWDTSVQSTGEFCEYKAFERVKLIGRGGTDPKVVFDYLDSKECKVKPIVTLMFTDGYFDVENITPNQRKKYKDTIWIMTRDHNKDFIPPFGRKAVAKFN